MQGKTYSMIGPRLGTTAFDKQQLLTESDGFLARAYANVFQSIEARQSEMHVEVRASCCEIYHEQVTQGFYPGGGGVGPGWGTGEKGGCDVLNVRLTACMCTCLCTASILMF